MKKNTHLKALLTTALGVLLISLESLFIKLTTIEAVTFAFYIGIFMFLSINVILFSTKKKATINLYKEGITPILICGGLLGLSNIFFISAIKTTTVANTVMIIASTPLFSALFSYFINKEKIRKNIIISSFFIFLGLFIIFSSQLGSGDFLGNIYALICTNLFALAFVILSKYNHVNRFTITAFAGIVTAVVSFFFINSFLIDYYTLVLLLITGTFISPVARVLIGIGTKQLPASEVGLMMIIETVMAPVWVWFVLKEIPENSTFVGGAIILTTLLLNSIYILKYKTN